MQGNKALVSQFRVRRVSLIYVLLKGFLNAFFIALSNKNSRHTTFCCICPCQIGLIRVPPTTQMSYVIWDGTDTPSIFIDLAKLPQAAGTTCKFSRHSISFNQEDITVRTCSVTLVKVLNRYWREKHCDAAPCTSQRRFVEWSSGSYLSCQPKSIHLTGTMRDILGLYANLHLYSPRRKHRMTSLLGKTWCSH